MAGGRHCGRVKPRPATRRSRLSIRLATALLCAVPGWSCVGSTDIGGPDGMWSLVAVDGVGVPATIGPDLTIVDGDLHILVGDRRRFSCGSRSFATAGTSDGLR